MRGLFKILNQFALYICVVSFFYFSSFTSVNAQDKPDHASVSVEMLSEYTRLLYGTDDIVVNGRTYIPNHYNARGNPYFLNDQWTESTLVIDGKKYDGQEILYNIDTERLILKSTINKGDKIMLILNTEFIDSFYLGDHYFINGLTHVPQSNFPGFVEQIYAGSFTVLVRHQKSFVNEYTNITPKGFYSNTKSINYIYINGKLTELVTKKSLLQYFSNHKKEVKIFLRKNKIKYKQASSNQLKQLFKYCDDITSN